MPYPNEHSARIKDPKLFNPDSFRSKNLKTAGVRIIIGKMVGSDSMSTQAYRFSVDQFTVAEAKQWLKDNGVKYLSFESAENKSEIKHVGVLGMHWGVRKARVPSSEEHVNTRGLRKKKIRTMTNKELQDVITRMNLEKQYKTLNPSIVSKGAKSVGSVLGTIGKVTGAIAAVSTAVVTIKKAYDALPKTK